MISRSKVANIIRWAMPGVCTCATRASDCTAEIVARITKKNESAKSFPRNSRYMKALENTKHQYVYQSLTIENLSPNDEASLVGVKKATSEMEKIRLGSMTVENLSHLHRCLMMDSEPEIAGQLRKKSVWIIQPLNPRETTQEVVKAPSAQFVKDSLPKLVNIINMNPFENQEHPIIHALMCKLSFVYLHPYIDGNGRLSRVILNGLLRAHGYPYVVIPAADKDEYFEAITTYCVTDSMRPFLRFGLKCVEKSVDLFVDDLETNS